jgi:hypothetical protein
MKLKLEEKAGYCTYKYRHTDRERNRDGNRKIFSLISGSSNIYGNLIFFDLECGRSDNEMTL